VGATPGKFWVDSLVFDSMDRCFAHSSIFEQNDLVMVAGFATPHVLERENLVQRSAEMGAYLVGELRQLAQHYELISKVRSNGMMIGMEFGETFFLSTLEVVLSGAHRFSDSGGTTTKNLALRTARSA
jgi:ornithine--oxo-acid transaminase